MKKEIIRLDKQDNREESKKAIENFYRQLYKIQNINPVRKKRNR